MSDESSNDEEEAMEVEVEAVVEEGDEEGDDDQDDGGDEMGEASAQASAVLEAVEEMPGDDDADSDHDHADADADDPVESTTAVTPVSNGRIPGKVLRKPVTDTANELEAHEDLDDEEPEIEAYGGDDGDNEDDDDGDEEVLAAVVLEDDDGEDDDQAQEVVEVEVAQVVVKPSSASVPKKQPRKKVKKAKHRTKDKDVQNNHKKKKKKKKPSQAPDEELFGTVAPERREAAADARALLQDTVPTLPVAIAESQVRSFGRILVEPNMDQSVFASTVALYPIGFSCDRYEFSPVHGRILKMRCSILSGRAIKEKQKAGGHDVSSELPNGPVFRVVWGRGVDEDVDDVDYPFDPTAHARPLKIPKGKSVTVPEEPLGSTVTTPGVGMRVKVRFDKNQYFCGTVVKVKDAGTKKKRKQSEVLVRYDDGSSETAIYPDPDIALLMPGTLRDVSWSVCLGCVCVCVPASGRNI